MDSSILENQMDSSIQRGKAQLQAQYNATAQATTSKVAGVLHDITMPTGAALIGNIGKGAMAVARNTGLVSAPEGGYADTLIQKGVSGVVKKGVKQAIGKATGSSTEAGSDAGSSAGSSASSSAGSSATTTATTTATTAEEGEAFTDAGSDIFSNVGSSASSSLFKAVNITTDEDAFSNAQSASASTQSGAASTSGNTGDAGLSLQGGDEDGVGARLTNTADNSTDLGDAPQGGGGGSSGGGEAVEDSAEGAAKKVVVEGAEKGAEDAGAEGAEGALATATAESTLFDDVPVAGLAITGLLAVGTEVASWFEKSAPTQLTQVGVQASNATGLTTI